MQLILVCASLSIAFHEAYKKGETITLSQNPHLAFSSFPWCSDGPCVHENIFTPRTTTTTAAAAAAAAATTATTAQSKSKFISTLFWLQVLLLYTSTIFMKVLFICNHVHNHFATYR